MPTVKKKGKRDLHFPYTPEGYRDAAEAAKPKGTIHTKKKGGSHKVKAKKSM